MHHLKKFKTLYAALLLLAGVILFLYHFPPDQIVAFIGVENSYLATFLIASIGGLTSVFSGVFYAAVATFSSGGANPWLLGLAGGVGIAIGDSLIFALLYYGVQDIPERWKQRVETVRRRIDQYPAWMIYGGLLLILGFSPVPNDIVMFALVMLGFRYLKIAPILIISGITITTITALLGQSLSAYFFG